ncbi:MAG: hypothetical protein F6K37_07940 [Moorea sp. SIO4E2]|nr:hypothetical protein [Moorena sp. SIO4E2]NEQ05879.1 hypothetical protein [Moorena sp. SIO4E2]
MLLSQFKCATAYLSAISYQRTAISARVRVQPMALAVGCARKLTADG